MQLLLIIVLVLLLVGGLPLGVHYGYAAPSGLVGIILIVVLILALTGRL